MLRSCYIRLASTQRSVLPELILKFFLGAICVSLVSCAMESNEAPVSDLNAIVSLPQTKVYRTQDRGALRLKPQDPTYNPNSAWIWPTYGNVLTPFTQLNKGLNIASTVGACAYASASGVVVYSGDALKAYGNLIIVKHNAEFLSAYAYVSQILVKEGQQVTKGQCIAKMGATYSRKAMLHFEIRHRGQPVNPLSYLPRR